MKIVIGAARGLKYLHTELDPPFTVSEVCSNAVYLTEDFTPKVTLKPTTVSLKLYFYILLNHSFFFAAG